VLVVALVPTPVLSNEQSAWSLGSEDPHSELLETVVVGTVLTPGATVAKVESGVEVVGRSRMLVLTSPDPESSPDPSSVPSSSSPRPANPNGNGPRPRPASDATENF
jgi:hypothetical protein